MTYESRGCDCVRTSTRKCRKNLTFIQITHIDIRRLYTFFTVLTVPIRTYVSKYVNILEKKNFNLIVELILPPENR